MDIYDIIIIGISLAMDAVCVSISNGICMKRSRLRHAVADAGAFGVFQGMMPVIGFFAGSLFVGVLSRYSYLLVFGIFLLLGGKMILDAVRGEQDEGCRVMTFRLLLVQATATSIDALAVGVGFSVMGVGIFTAAIIISVTTFLLSFIAFFLGKKVGTLLNRKAGIFGGVLLLAMAVKVLVENLVF